MSNPARNRIAYLVIGLLVLAGLLVLRFRAGSDGESEGSSTSDGLTYEARVAPVVASAAQLK